jgi:AraC-like DNA-binding protein
VISFERLAAGPGFTLGIAACPGDHRAWSPVNAQPAHSLVLVQRGRFRRRALGVVSDLDPTVAYLAGPDEEERFAHPHGGDRCTWVSLTPKLWYDVTGGNARPQVYVDGAVDLAHRRALAAARLGDAEAATERLFALLAAVSPPADTFPGSAGPDAALVARARGAIAGRHPAAGNLSALAEALGTSPYRLSRSFSVHMGVSLTRYRNRIRVGDALERLEAGERDLAGLAAHLGFADQAHLTRTMRAHVGHPPAAVRRLLTEEAQQA